MEKHSRGTKLVFGLVKKSKANDRETKILGFPRMVFQLNF